MKGKVIREITFPILVISIFCTLNYVYAQSTYFRSIDGLFRYENVPEDLQIVNVGSSHGMYGIDYSMLSDYRCFNFAFAAQAPYFDERLLETYKNNLSDDCIVIIPLSYFSLYMDPADGLSAQLPRYYRILDVDKIPDVSLKLLVNYRYFPVLSSKKNLVKIFSSRVSPTYSVPDGVTEEINLNGIGQGRAAYHLELAADQTLNSEQSNSLTGILQLCSENGWNPVVVTTPLTIYYNQFYSKDFVNIFHSQINEFISDYPEAVYWDYSSDERFYEHPEYFVDTDHLNQAGRELFTKILFKDCRSHGLI